MDGITVGKAIAEQGISIVTGILLVFIVGLACYLVKQIMSMFKKELKDLHKDSIQNAELNKESIVLIKEHSKETKKDNKNFATIISNLLKASNGSNPAIAKLQKEFKEFKEGKK